MVAALIYRHNDNLTVKKDCKNGRVKKICRNCEHWRDSETIDDWRMTHDFLTGRCDEAESAFDVVDMRSNEVAVNSGHDGGIYFGENFGCIHFQQKI